MRIIPVMLQEHELIDVCQSSWMGKLIYHHSHTEINAHWWITCIKTFLSLQNTNTFLFLGLLQHQVLSVAWASPTVGQGEEQEKTKALARDTNRSTIEIQ